MMREAVDSGLLTATDNMTQAVQDVDVVMVCVGTPTGDDGEVDLQAIDRVTTELSHALAESGQECVVMIRSTVPPGTTRQRIAPALRRANPRVSVCHHPEFLREGSALADWDAPPMIVYGADGEDVEAAQAAMEAIYVDIDAPFLAMATPESEMMKYACNVYHAMKIDFANEIGSLAAAVGADPARVMDAFCHDTKLNVSAAYLRPGFAFGGSCLPKDTRAVAAEARRRGIRLPLIEAVLESNEEHLSRQVERVLAAGRRPTLLVGLSFKPGTDDLRESPMVELAEKLLGKGVPLSIYDGDLLPGKLMGANARYIHEHLPHLNMLLQDDFDEALRQASTAVIAKPVADLDDLRLMGKTVIDLSQGPRPVDTETITQRKVA